MVNGADWQQEPINANRFIVECLHKRRKLSDVEKAVPEEQERNYIQDYYLSEELLVEILCRLPISKYAIQCKWVCKRWNALISHPYFISRFIAFKENENEEPSSLAIVVRVANTRRSQDTWKGLIMHLKDPVFNPHNFSHAPLPCLVDGDVTATDLTLDGACNDLLLYCRDKFEDRYDYYICNVQTREWLQLPSLFYHGPNLIGFICNSYYSQKGRNSSCNVIKNAASYRYNIVVIPYTPKASKKFSAHLFSSYTSQWTNIVLSLPRRCKLVANYGFSFAGMLHFCCSEGIFCFNPNRSVVKNRGGGITRCHLIPMPAGFPYARPCVGVRDGRLQLSKIIDRGTLQMWVLKDYKRGEWSLQHIIASNEFVLLDPCLARHQHKTGLPLLKNVVVLAQHPTNPDVIYVLGPHWILLCNVQKRTVEVASPISVTKSLQLFSTSCFDVFPLRLSIWPAPLKKRGMAHCVSCLGRPKE